MRRREECTKGEGEKGKSQKKTLWRGLGAQSSGADLWAEEQHVGMGRLKRSRRKKALREDGAGGNVVLLWKRKLCDMIARSKCSSCY